MVLSINNHLLHIFEESQSSKLQIQDTQKSPPSGTLKLRVLSAHTLKNKQGKWEREPFN